MRNLTRIQYGFFRMLQTQARLFQKGFALFRQFNPSCGAPQQGDLVVLLQRLDVPGDRRLTDEQPRGGPGEAALAGHRIKGTELEQVHE